MNTTQFFNQLQKRPIENIFNAEWIKQSENLRSEFDDLEFEQIIQTVLNLEVLK